MVVKRRPDRGVARTKQEGQGLNDPTPAFTFHGERLPYTKVLEMAQKLVGKAKSEGAYPDSHIAQLDEESLNSWYSVMGGRCGSYVFAESTLLFHGMTPHQETGSPIPYDIFWESWNDALKEQFPGYGPSRSTLKTRHLFVGTAPSGGIAIPNKDGAAGYPYSNFDQDTLRKELGRPKFKGRATKGVVHQHAMNKLVAWIEAGMPMSGDLYRDVALPATLAYRGDREVDLFVRMAASRGSDSSYHVASDELAALMPGRSVIIVPTVMILAQSLWAQPLGDHIAGVASPGFDWVDPDHTVRRLDSLRKADLAQADPKPLATVGADASGWDRDIVGQFHAGETAWYCAMFPKDVSLLFIDTPLPVDVTDVWVADKLAELSAGGEGTYEVTQILSDGSETVGKVKARVVRFDFHEFICKVMTLVNDAPLAWGDYEADAVGQPFSLSGSLPELKGYSIKSNGGRRSGDGITGLGNSWTNIVVSKAAAKMSVKPELDNLRRRRASLHDTPFAGGYDAVDLIGRGDDLAILIRKLGQGKPSELVACGIASIGMRANAKKQEASDIPGLPVFGFANVITTPHYMGKLLGRSLKRYMVQESRGLNKEMLDALRDAGNDSGLSDSLVATTTTAKSRLAPLAGFPLMSSHPVVDDIAEWAVHNDAYRLFYVAEDSFDDSGQVTDEAREVTRRAQEAEAKAQARLRSKRENVSVDLERLKEVYLGSTIHDLIEEYALADNYTPTREMPRVDNHALFKEASRSDSELVL